MPRTRTYGLDFDTIAYANRIKAGAGTVLSNEALKQINKFVIGIKRMKLWDKMVCWPMRSIHNAGTGSTVYSLGGLGVYNGTMVNSPMWDRLGIQKNTGSTGYLSTQYDLETTGSAIFFFNTINTTNSRGVAHFGHGVNSASGYPISYGQGGGLNNFFGQSTTPPSIVHSVQVTSAQNLNQFYSHGVSWNINNASLFFNGVLVLANGAYSSGPYTLSDGPSMSNIIILGSYGNASSQGCSTLHSFGSLFKIPLTTEQHKLIYDLYRVTLARNLGLI
jgi:hypothetical protein